MTNNLASIKYGLAFVMLGLLFGIGLGVAFGVNEDRFEAYVAQGIASLLDLLDSQRVYRQTLLEYVQACEISPSPSLGLDVQSVGSDDSEGARP